MPSEQIAGVVLQFLGGQALEVVQIVEGVHTLESTGVDEGHKEVPSVSAVEGAIEQSALSVEDDLIVSSFANSVV